jgi:HK97 family phage prohead protease
MKLYKDFQTKIEDVDEKGRVLVAANAIGNVDSDEDRSMPGSFSKTLRENFNRLKWFLNHRTDQLLGVPVEGKEDGTYLKMLGQLNMKKQLSLDTYEDYKLYAEYGRSLEHSIGVEAIKKQERDEIREVYEWKMWEYSTLTAWGANENTPLLGIKSDKDISELIEWFTIRLKKGNYTDERFSDIEKQLLQLKSLLIEPDNSTQYEPMKSEPASTTRIIRKESDFILTTFIN